MDKLLSIDQASAMILESCEPLGTEELALSLAVGRGLAEPMVADRALPPFHRAMMDGVAFPVERCGVGEPLRIAGLHAAGDAPPRALEPGEAWEIMTGAMVPDDCNAVVPYEDLAESFTLKRLPEVAAFIHSRGLDAGSGDVLVPAGVRIGPGEIAIAASVGVSKVKVYLRPRISIITTGDEAIPVDEVPEPWQIRRSNGAMLEAALIRSGHAPVFHQHVSDDFGELERAVERALEAGEWLILSGGISKGKKDHVKEVMAKRFGAPAFHGVFQRPGKPLAFWSSGEKKVFALPGNPVAVLATFTRHVFPALYRCEGCAQVPQRVFVADVKPAPRFARLLPVGVGPSGLLVPHVPKNSGDYVTVAGTVGIVEVPCAADFKPGQPFSFYPFS